MAMKHTKPIESIVIKRTQTLAKPPPNPDDGLKILGQLVGYTLVAASHQQGFLAGLQQLVNDRKELREFRESTNWIVCPQCGRRSTYKLASAHFPHHTTCRLRRIKSIP